MKKLICSSTLLLSTILYAQSNPVEIVEFKNDTNIILSAVNHLDERQEVEIDIQSKNLKGNRSPLVKMVGAKDTVKMVTLFFGKDAQWSYNFSYQWAPKPTPEEKKLAHDKSKQIIFSTIDGLDSGISIFTKEGCSRSSFATSYMKRKKADYRQLNTSNNDLYKKVLSALIKLEDSDIGYYTYPVILVDGKLYYSIENLKSFMKSLVANKQK